MQAARHRFANWKFIFFFHAVKWKLGWFGAMLAVFYLGEIWFGDVLKMMNGISFERFSWWPMILSTLARGLNLSWWLYHPRITLPIHNFISFYFHRLRIHWSSWNYRNLSVFLWINCGGNIWDLDSCLRTNMSIPILYFWFGFIWRMSFRFRCSEFVLEHFKLER